MTTRESDLEQGWEIQDPFYNDLYQRAEHLLEKRQNGIHTKIVYHLALKLLDSEEGEARIVLPAAILHDVGYSQIPDNELLNSFGVKIKKPELSRLHEIEGVRFAKAILENIGYPEAFTEKILSIIDGHDTRKTALGPDDMVVKDADKLWRFTYEGFHIDCTRFNLPPSEWLGELTGCISEWFFTKTGEKMAMEEAALRTKDIETLQ